MSRAGSCDASRGPAQTAGFTLIEVLVAIAVVAITIGGDRVGDRDGDARRAVARTASRPGGDDRAPSRRPCRRATSPCPARWSETSTATGGALDALPYTGGGIAPIPDSPWFPETLKIRVQSPSGAIVGVETVRLRLQAHQMMRRRAHRHAGIAGFTLIEALVATALMGVVLTRWLRSPANGCRIGIAGSCAPRAASLSASRSSASSAMSRRRNTSRRAATPRTRCSTALRPPSFSCARRSDRMRGRASKIVRIAQIRDGNESGAGQVDGALHAAGRRTDTLRSCRISPIRSRFCARPIVVSFAYAGRDGVWKDTWQNAPELPAVVRMTVREGDSDRALSVSTAALIHVDLSAACVQAEGPGPAGPAAWAKPRPASSAASGPGAASAGQDSRPLQAQNDCNLTRRPPRPRGPSCDRRAGAA